MRISDWSSDVCSSDVDIDLHSGTYLEQLPKLVRDGKVPIAEVDAAVRRVLEAKYKLGLFDDPYRYSDRRSEEHTSELQSLMRISYAVFCLKNKKTQRTLKRQITNTEDW